MRLTVLGSSASYAGAGQACAGHLVESGATRILLDCGNGVLANLAQVADPLTLGAVFVSHAHPDHICDLFALQALLRYAPGGTAPPLPLHAPVGLLDRMGALLSERGKAELAEAFVQHVLHDGRAVVVGDLTVTAHAVEHAEESFAFVVEGDGARLCYTADTSAGDPIGRIAANADLLLAEATLPEQYAGRAPHMTAREAGTLATTARAARLVLTHIWPTSDRGAMLREAAEAFPGPVSLARESDIYEIEGRARETARDAGAADAPAGKETL